MTNQSDFQTLMRQGTYLLQRGTVSKALPLLEQAHALNPTNMDVRLNLSSAYILSKKFKQAATILETLTVDDPGNAMFWMNLGAAYLGNPVLANEESQNKAINAFKQALEQNTNTPHAAYNIGLVYRDQKKYEDALYWFRQAHANNPDDTDAKRFVTQLEEQLAS